MNHENGQTIVEALIAISILTIGVFGMLNLLNQSLGLNTFVTSQYIGSNLAMEGVEVIKNIIDSNFLQGKPFNDGLNNGYYEIQYNSNSLGAPKCSLSDDKNACFNSSNNLYKDNNGIYSYNTSNAIKTPFKRIVRIENLDQDGDGKVEQIKVNSIVQWTIKGGTYEINAEDHFFNWRQ